MDFRDEVFLAVAENLSFSRAADILRISQPAVTQHIKKIEERFDVALFSRKGNRIYLTKAGEIVYQQLKAIKQHYSELDFTLGSLTSQFKGSLRIGSSSTISQYVIPAVLAAFHKHYPQTELSLYNGNSFEMEQKLLNNDLDLALVENNSSQANLHYQRFADDEIVAITGAKSSIAQLNSLSLFDFQNIPLVLREQGSGTLEVINNALIKAGVDLQQLNILLHLGSTEAIKSFLDNFEGIALVSAKAIEKELLLNTLKIVPVKNLSIKRHFRIALPPGPQRTIPSHFVNFLLHYNI